MKQQKMLNTNKGITLIALVITIIVMLILVAVTISMAVNGGLFDYAGKAVGETKNAIANEGEGYDKYVQDMLIKYGVEEQTVTNPYDADAWEYAWTYTDGVWSERINKGEVANGDVVAKFYKTGNKIIPEFKELNIKYAEDDEYHLVIEGKGDMGDLITQDEDAVKIAWQYGTEEFIGGENIVDVCLTPYITKLIVCDGITSIGDMCAMYAIGLNTVELCSSLTELGVGCFGMCTNLTDINIPNNVTDIKDNAFYYCSSLKNIHLPNGVTNIGTYCFASCTSLVNINLPSSVASLGALVFYRLHKFEKYRNTIWGNRALPNFWFVLKFRKCYYTK